MGDPFYCGAYWGPRAEPAASCASRLAQCLADLGAAHPVLGAWHRKGRSRSAASGGPIDTGAEALASLLAGGRHRRDVGGEVIDELGFTQSLWNRNPVAVSFSTLCGAVPATTAIRNHFVLELPAADDRSAELYDPAVATRMVAAIVSAWRPEWATFAGYAMRARQDATPPALVVGWQTYLSGVEPRPAPAGLRVDTIADGVLVTAGPDPLRVSDDLLDSAVQYVATLTSRRA
jgi:hypothetical protein